jgi:cell division transport system ATP-binding protein
MMIELSNVAKRYPQGFEALHNISLRIEAGEMVFLTGHSGAGKSTLLRLVTRIEQATRGQVVINGQNLGKMKPRTVPHFRRSIGMVFQDHKLLHDRNVYDNVALPLIASGYRPRDISRRVHAALDKVGLLKKELSLPITLSGGEQQRVGIARAVVNRPNLLVADEPTGNLDARLSDEIFDLFNDFNYHGVTVLVATHDLRHIERLKKRTLRLHQGSLQD